jgi:hypothetical protein
MPAIEDIDNRDWVYDIEAYSDVFMAGFVHARSGTRYLFEVSDRIDQSGQFIAFMNWQSQISARHFGYNNIGFDYPVVHHLIGISNMRDPNSPNRFSALDAHYKTNEIINTDWNDRFNHRIWESDRMVTQGDLLMIHHFDNTARSTSLKKLEINMRSERVVDLPYPPDQLTTHQMRDEIMEYMCHDINETLRFYYRSFEQIRFRDNLAKTNPDLGDVLNYNDGKIGAQLMIRQLEDAGTPCYNRGSGRKTPRQTIRSTIAIADVLSPKLSFRHPDFQRIYDWFKDQEIMPNQTKGFFGMYNTVLYGNGYIATMPPIDKDRKKKIKENDGEIIDGVSAIMNDFQYDFGSGGIHGSLHKTAVHADKEWEIWDWDVASYYPNLAITHRFFPDHLSEQFCNIYEGIYKTRKTFSKGTAENAMYKLALNVPYGQSNSVYSPFYDPQYTMATTINGQLLLCMLAEWITHYEDQNGQMVSLADHIQMIQINTDGLTLRIKKEYVSWMHDVCQAWQNHTGLELESAQYSSMFIRDVNNYFAVTTEGKVKRIGAYCHETPNENPNTRELQWHQNHSNLVSRKAAEAHMRHGTDIAEFIMAHRDPFDFQLSVKIKRSDRLTFRWGEISDPHGIAPDEEIQRTTRYYVSTDGGYLTKHMPPLARTPNKPRETSIESGWTVTITNDMKDFRWDNVNWLYYIEAAKKLIVR